MVYPKAQHGASTNSTDVGGGVGAAFGVPQTPDLPKIEESVLAYWDADDTFRESVECRDAGTDGDNEFVFYDGPPFANGLPHYGHLLTGYAKDVVPRYMTMRGKRVERRFGWDTHGLPAELEAMRQLGLKTKDDILEMGVDTFNAAARESVLRYTGEWESYVRRMGRWVDFENDYKTLNPDFMESVLWVFKSLYDKGLIYDGFRVLPYCWSDETPLSNHELRMDEDVYQMRQDPAVTVGFRATSGELDGALLLVWTTTPWTLPSNLAIVVGTEIDYVVVESDLPTGTTERYVLAEALVGKYARELFGDPKADWSDRVVKRLKGSDLLQTAYAPPFDYFAGQENAFRVVEGDFVTTTDGTGLVHTAGAFGEDDYVVTQREGIEAVMPVGADGRFTDPVVDYAGMQVFDANPHIIDHLKAATRLAGREGERPSASRIETTEVGRDVGSVSEGTVLLKRETYDHSYPHCWRCRNPLIYKGVSSWFVSVTEIKDTMLRTNSEITWVPDNVKEGQFGKWLENARDWSITRNRFWGSPVPVWQSDDPAYPRTDVYGSFAELERDFGKLPVGPDGEPNLHRPYVDGLTRPNPDDPTGQSTMRRVEDVLDVWFDSGSMPYGQVHYPFENADWFEHHYPADFIVEYIGQTRGWFYTLHILAAALFDRPAFKSVICHGIVLGSDGQKMSKSLRNYPDVSEVFDRDGADAMRWFLMQSPILRGGNLAVTEEGIRQGVRQVVIPLWSSWYFFSLYANAEGYDAKWSTSSTDPLDRYILAKTHDLVVDLQTRMDAYDIAGACDSVQAFVEVLTNWYIRRSRERFWGSTGEGEAEAAFNTLYTVLEVLTRVAAPLLPFTTEQIWRGLTGARSVHLTDWPEAVDLPADDALVAAMDEVRAVCSTTLALRKAQRLRVRLPLASLTVVTADPKGIEHYASLVAHEVNVREVRIVDLADPAADQFGVEQRLSVNARAAGPRLGKEVQQVIKGSKSGDWSVGVDGTVTAGGLELQDGEYTLETVVAEGTDDAHRAVQMLPGGGFVVLDTQVTQELAREGLARDIVRAVQEARRGADLSVSDRISLSLAGDDEVWQAAVAHQHLIMSETLAVQFGAAGAGHPLEGVTATVGDGRSVTIAIQKASREH